MNDILLLAGVAAVVIGMANLDALALGVGALAVFASFLEME